MPDGQKRTTLFFTDIKTIKADTKTKLIEEYIVTDASVHDSQAIEQLLTEKDINQPLYADSAYIGYTTLTRENSQVFILPLYL